MDNWDIKFNEKIGEFTYDVKPSDEKVSAFFEKMDQSVNSKEETEVVIEKEAKTIKLMPAMLRVAAILFVVGISVVIAFRASEVNVSSIDGYANIELPDGSTVELNGLSTISYNKLSFMLGNRNVELEGEGFFEVEKGESFIVSSGQYQTRVLGTSFNILAADNIYNVVCYTGKVEVSNANVKEILLPGDGVNMQSNGDTETFKNTTSTPDWKASELEFNGISLTDVFEALGKTYGLTFINTEEYKALTYSGFFPTNDQNLALKLVLEPFEIPYSVEKDKVILGE